MSQQDVRFACPICRSPLEPVAADTLRCAVHDVQYRQVDGIWRFLMADRARHFDRFIREYERVREAEGRGSSNPAYYRALPFADLDGRLTDQWRIRARSFQALGRQVLGPFEAGHPGRLALDLGAGNGWLSYRLALRGWQVGAVDLLINTTDGLGAHRHYDATFTPIQAEFDHLPLATEQFDLVIFNGSLHYSTAYETTLAAALQVMKPDGRLIIMDSPVYRSASSGRQMVQERQQHFQRTYGFPSDALDSEEFLTYDRLEDLAGALGLHWRIIEPFYNWRWTLRPWIARLRGAREPAKFLLVVGRQR